MGLGVGVFLVAAGAILAFAVNIDTASTGVNLHTVGWILLGVGALGILLSMVFWSSWAGPGYFRRRTTTNVPPAGTTTTIDQY